MDFDAIESKLDNEELLYTAKRKVRLKRSIIWHIAVFLIAAPLVFAALPEILNSAFPSGDSIVVAHFDDEAVAAILQELRAMAFTFGQHNNAAASRTVARAANDLVNPSMNSANAHAAQYFAWGAYFAWGLFILSRLVLYAAPMVKSKEQKQVSAEYHRLVKGALDSDTVDLRENA